MRKTSHLSNLDVSMTSSLPAVGGGVGGVYKRGRREGLGGNNYFSIKPEGSRLAGQAPPVDIRP